MELVLTLLVAAGLAFIPANIAKNKGYSFGTWWFYGWLLFIVAFIHSLVLKDKNSVSGMATVQASGADVLKKYKELLDSGAITQEEYEVKKRQILGTAQKNNKTNNAPWTNNEW